MAFTYAPIPIVCVANENPGNPAPVSNGNIGEAATQTFNFGTPLAESTGYYAAWGGSDPSNAAAILGISMQAGQNLASAGVGVHGNFGAVQNQSNAKNFYTSGPVDAIGQGGCGIPFAKAGAGNIFIGTLGTGSTTTNVTPASTNVGVAYGLTKDSVSGNWYVDTNKVTVATNTAVIVTGIHVPATGTIGAATPVEFKFQSGVVQG